MGVYLNSVALAVEDDWIVVNNELFLKRVRIDGMCTCCIAVNESNTVLVC